MTQKLSERDKQKQAVKRVISAVRAAERESNEIIREQQQKIVELNAELIAAKQKIIELTKRQPV